MIWWQSRISYPPPLHITFAPPIHRRCSAPPLLGLDTLHQSILSTSVRARTN
ncbi:hypothetical protein HanXRQr2_Chr09g0370451 [Helianthus annuus]|uniref:Uncharacterized protein n=1 Tax=Helianthus annuus TaxID=4232 RepID=A0A9K3I307_HELAN|nr:hypothetical protein HanXRQr2_Chr09g0370451 [Helianthus annuus]KAJ0891679.1 hypothetical protein HanPSC8_Chr09g0356861 [Helianthus annuus]